MSSVPPSSPPPPPSESAPNSVPTVAGMDADSLETAQTPTRSGEASPNESESGENALLERSYVTRGRVHRRRARRRGRRRGWLMAFTILVALGSLGYLVGRRYVAQRLNIERLAQTQLVPILEKSLGRRVEIGRVETDYRSRVVLHDVVIGRDAHSPLGALAQAPTVTLDLDVFSLVLGRTDAAGALRHIRIDRPQLYLRRDARGRINLLQNLKSGAGAIPKLQFDIVAQNGRLWLQDDKTRSPRGIPLVLDAQNVTLGATVVSPVGVTQAPLSFQLAAPQVLAPREGQSLKNVAVRGATTFDAKRLEMRLFWKDASVPTLLAYLPLHGQLTTQSGRAGGTVTLTQAKNTLRWRADLRARGVTGQLAFLRDPRDHRPMRFENATGRLAADAQNLRFDGMTLRAPALNASLHLDGTASLNGRRLDLHTRSDRLETSQVAALLRAAVPDSRNLFNLSAAPLRANLRIARVGPQFALAGHLEGTNVAWHAGSSGAAASHSGPPPASGTVSAPQAGVDFKLRFGTGVTRAAGIARFAALKWQGPNSQNARAQLSPVAFRLLVAPGKTQWNADAQLPGFAGQSRGNTADARLLNVALHGDGHLTSARFAATGAHLNAGHNGTLTASSANGIALLRTANGNMRLALDTTLSGWSGQSPRFGTVHGATGTLQLAEFDLSRPRMSGVLRVSGASVNDLTAVRAATQNGPLRDVGTLGAQLRFADFDPDKPQGGTARGTFTLSQARIHAANRDYALRDTHGEASYAAGHLRVANVGAQSEFGPIQADAEIVPGQPIAPRFAVTLPRLRLTSALLTSALPAGIQLPKGAIGRVRLASLPANAASNHAGISATSFLADIDLTLPQLAIPAHDSRGRPLNARAANAHLRGNGTLVLSSTTTPQSAKAATHNTAPHFVGQLNLSVPVASLNANPPILLAGAGTSGLSVPSWLRGATLKNARAQFNGSLESGMTQLTANWEFERGELLLPGNASGAKPGAPAHLRLAAAHGIVQQTPDGFALPRLAANFAGGSAVGHFSLHGAQLDGELLGQNLNAARIANLLGNAMVQRGTLWTRIALSGSTTRPTAHIEARGYNLAVHAGAKPLPVDSIRAEFDLGPNLNVVPVRQLVAWSRGARLAASGEVRRQGNGFALNVNAQLDGLRARDALQLAGADTAALRDANADGLFSFTGQITGDAGANGATTPHLAMSGVVAMKLARAYGLQIPEATSNAEFALTSRGPRLHLTKLAARVSGLEGESRAGGEIALDVPGGTWQVSLQAHDVGTERLARAARGGLKRQLGDRLIPLRGTLQADAEVRGSLQTVGGRLSALPTAGTIRVESGPLRWRDHDIGALHADVAIHDGLAQATQVELRASGEAGSTNTPYIRLTGTLPLAADAPGLAATVEADGGQAALIVAALRETRDFLRNAPPSGSTGASADAAAPDDAVAETTPDDSDTPSANPIVRALDRVLEASLALPGLEGRASGKVHLTGSWRQPIADVESLQLTQVKARGPGGDLQNLPSLDLAFRYDAPHEALTIHRADLRLQALSGDEDDDTLLRVQDGGTLVPGGTLSLSARVLNANLSQLAPWVPLLRDTDGAPLLRGELDQVTFNVGGTTENPELSGFVQARNLNYRGYTLDRLRISNFKIANGELNVKPGDLTIAKGAFQSSVGSVVLPWDWNAPGPDRDRPIQIELPLQRDDFGALVGIFVPAVAGAQATDFGGSLKVEGSLNDPLISGQLTIRNGNLRLNPVTLPFDAGLRGVSGTVSFQGDTLQIDADDPLHGELVPARDVSLDRDTATGNPTAGQRDPNALLRRSGAQTPTTLHARWQLSGRIQRDANAPLTMTDLLASSRYDLEFTAREGAYQRPGFGGIRDAVVAGVWRTGDGIAARNQRVSWMVTTHGTKPTRGVLDTLSGRERGDGGTAFSTGAMRLRPDFASNMSALLRGTIEAPDIAALRALPVWNDFPAKERDDLTPRLSFAAFRLDGGDAGAGNLDGTLTLDNLPVAEPKLPLPIHTVALQTTTDAVLSAWAEREKPYTRIAAAGSPPPDPAQRAGDSTTATSASSATPTVPLEKALPVRLHGVLTFSSAEVFGMPSGAGGGAARELPDGPAFDVRLQLGQNVSFSTSTLRATLGGELRLTGTPRDPLLVGRLETRSGQVRFPGANARLVSGELQVTIFRDPETGFLQARADIDAAAHGRAGRYTVDLTLRGPLELSGRETTNAQNLSVQITTDPPLSQDQAFAQLLGTVPIQDETGDRASQAYARAVVGLLSAPLFSGIERSLEQVFGVSSISLDYQLDEPLTVEVGKALGDRVYLSYQREVTSNRPGVPVPYTIRVEFRVKGNLQLGIQSDERQRRQITLQKTFRF